jgi:glucosamine-6-phosphate deaminase
MPRPISKVAPGWWDYTTLEPDLLRDVAKLTVDDLLQLSRPGFEVRMFDTLYELFCAEALEYVEAWQESTPDNPAGVCGPIGPTEHLPLVAQMVNSRGLDLRRHEAHFWGMDEWLDEQGQPVGEDFPLSFAKADKDLCFRRIKPELAMPDANLHFPTGKLEDYARSYDDIRCVVMQGGQGDVKHWAFNDPVQREGRYQDEPPSPETYRQRGTRMVDLHPLTIMQTARMSGNGLVDAIPTRACTVGPRETWKAERVSIYQPGYHDNAFGQRLTAFMIGKRLPDTAVPLSLLADHPNVTFNFYRHGIGVVDLGIGAPDL